MSGNVFIVLSPFTGKADKYLLRLMRQIITSNSRSTGIKH